MITLQKRSAPSALMNYLGPVFALFMTVMIGGLLFYLMGFNPIKTLSAFFITPISSQLGLTELAVKASPMILCALGLSFCFRANQWNIGAEGQLLCGGMTAGAVALALMDNDAPWVIYVVIASGVLAGMMWAAIPALLKVHFNTNEILTSLMLTYVAYQLLQFLIYGPLKDFWLSHSLDGYSARGGKICRFFTGRDGVDCVFDFWRLCGVSGRA